MGQIQSGNIMKKYLPSRVTVAVILAGFLHATTLLGAEAFHQSTIKILYPLADGAFVLVFNSDSPSCTAPGSPDYYYVVAGQNGVNVDGSKKLYAAATLGFPMNKPVAIVFDSTTASCYINRISVTN